MNAQYARLVITNNYFLAKILYYFFFAVGVGGIIFTYNKKNRP